MSLHEDWNDGIRAFNRGEHHNPHEYGPRQQAWKEGHEYAEHTKLAVEDDKKRKQQR